MSEIRFNPILILLYTTLVLSSNPNKYTSFKKTSEQRESHVSRESKYALPFETEEDCTTDPRPIGENVYYCVSTSENIIYGEGPTYDFIRGGTPIPGLKDSFSIRICEGVTVLGNYLFQGSITRDITISSSVEIIKPYTFRDANFIENFIVDPNSQYFIGDRCLYSTSGAVIKYPVHYPSYFFQLSDIAKSIEDYAFESCNLQTLVLGPAVKEISPFAFWNCQRLMSIIINSSNPYFTNYNSAILSKDGTVFVKFPSGVNVKSYYIPDGVKTICQNAFQKCFYLNNLYIGQSVRYIHPLAFDIENFETVEIEPKYYKTGSIDSCPAILTKNGSVIVRVAPNCSKQNLEISNSVTSIGEYAFSNSIITNIALERLTNIGDYAFSSCSSLKSMSYMSENEPICREEVFFDSPKLKSVKVIGKYQGGTFCSKPIVTPAPTSSPTPTPAQSPAPTTTSSPAPTISIPPSSTPTSSIIISSEPITSFTNSEPITSFTNSEPITSFTNSEPITITEPISQTQSPDSDNKKSKNVGMIVGISFAVIIAIVVIGVIYMKKRMFKYGKESLSLSLIDKSNYYATNDVNNIDEAK